MQYQVMQHVRGREFVPALDDTTRKPLVLSSAKEAAVVAAELTQKLGLKFQPRPIKPSNDWRNREKKRLENGEYKPVIWHNQPWWKEIKDHFAHISVKNPAQIAFTPDPEKGEADKQTVMAPGKYLKKFFGDVLTDEMVRDFAMQHSTEFEQNELKFASTVEEIERVYKPQLGSCFSGTTKANLYGSGDFAVAYIEDENGKVTARSVCVPGRKVFVRPYGDYERISSLLKKQGYKESSYGSSKFSGLRVLKKWHWTGYYADWGGVRLKPDPKDDTYLIIE